MNLQLRDQVKVLRGVHKGRVGQVVQTTPDGVLYGVRFGPRELFFLTKDEVGKLKEGATD